MGIRGRRKWRRFVRWVDRNKQYIIVGAVALVLVIACVVILVVTSVKHKKSNNAVTDVTQSTMNTEAVNDSMIDNTTDADKKEIDTKESETAKQAQDEDPQKQASNEEGREVSAAALPGDNSSYSNGIDVSKWQGKIDWKKVAASGIDYAIIRVGYRTDINGTICEDEYASYNLISAQSAGIKTGVYFFSTAVNETEAKEEAEWVTDYIAGYSITYPVVYNCEDFTSSSSRMYGLTNEERTANALAFMDTIADEGYDAMLYANKNELSYNSLWNTNEIENRYPVWVAAYSDGVYPSVIKPIYSGASAMWQYTNKGVVDGISGYVDMNVAYFSYDGDADPFNPDKPQESVNVAELGIVFKSVDETVTAKEETNLRSTPDMRGELIAVLYNGNTAKRTGIGDNGWSRLEYNGDTVYAITSYLTTDLNSRQSESSNGSFVVNDMEFSSYSDNVTAKDETNLRTIPSTDITSTVVVTLKKGEYVKRTAKSARGWSQVEYNGQKLYAITSYLTN